MQNKVLVLIGLPGSGKGVQAEKIFRNFEIPIFSPGNQLRKEMEKETKIGKEARKYLKDGKLVPDNIIKNFFDKSLERTSSIILDGFPRNMNQLKILEKCTKDKTVAIIYLEIEKDVVMTRLLNRLICSKCQVDYNTVTKPPKKVSICNYCFGQLSKREDDNEQIINYRFEVYEKESKPLLKELMKANFFAIEANQNIEEVYSDIKVIIQNL